ncbi:MAG: fused DSP-PTPase phosphatase/NAD kinase-like protein [Polyangiaceae bacterium]
MLRGSLVWVALPLVLTGCSAARARSASDLPADATDSTADDVAASVQPANFAQVRDGLYRGGHPSNAQLDYLKSIGVDTIVDLEIGDFIEATPWSISDEESAAKAKGFTFIRKPMSAFEPFVSDKEMSDTMTLLDDSSNGTVYVHCKHGQDRTGLVIGLERVLDEGWEPADAYQEMLDRGFHPEFIGLKHYFDEKTGYDDD